MTTVTAVLLAGCTVPPPTDRSRLEPVETYVAVFERYNKERRDLSIEELQGALRAFLEDSSQENRRRLEHVYSGLDVTRVLGFLAKNSVSRSTHECLQHVECGAYAKGTMKLWAIARFTPIRICRGQDSQWARLQYQGTSEDGVTAYRVVDFLKEGSAWKISFESFGELEGTEHNELFQATCEDARA